jgi:predicted ATP-grasp superfamily ATP-dependent carboligase
MFINDIVNDINAGIDLLADDTSLYIIVDNPRDTATS